MNIWQISALGRASGRNRIEEVERLCNRALADNKFDMMALMALSDVYWRNARKAEAIQVAKEVLEVDPDDFYALRISADVCAQLGNSAEAYLYAKRLLDAAIPRLSELTYLAKFFSAFWWLPKDRRLDERLIHGVKQERESYSDWLEWANSYVAWYESRE